MSVRISRALHDRLIDLAAAAPHQEVCGLLFGLPGYVVDILETCNVSNAIDNSFEIDPQNLIMAYKAERAGGPKVIGHFHSHPNGRLEPSSRDIAATAGDGALWLIIADGCVGAWLSTAPSALQPTSLVVTD
jgi:desampylase